MTMVGYAVDLGGTKTAAARIEGAKVLEKLQVSTDSAAGLEAQIEAVAGLLARLGYQAGQPLGVAVTGRLDAGGGWHAVNTGTLSAISAAPLLPALRARFGAATIAVNDAAAAAFAEAALGAGQGVDNFGYITVSTGVGGGIVLSGRLVGSPNGLAGHVGFVGSRYSENICGSGRLGTVESVAGGRAIAAASGLPDAKSVFAALPQYEPIIDRSAAAIAGLIGDLTAVLGLEKVAIGGSIGLAPGYLDRVQRHLADEPELFRPALEPAQLSHDSGMIGACLLATNPRL